MTFLRYARQLDLYSITTEPTELYIVTKNDENVTGNDAVIISASIVSFCLFFLIYFCYRMKKERNCF
jgi:hypothetical protein